MYSKGIAVVAITRLGVETALKIKEALDHIGLSSSVYAPKKYNQNGIVPIDKKIPEFVNDTYSTVDALVAVMATGIIIRAVAPHLESKLTDPAVIGVDVSGKFVISLLSGHYGGANELTRIIAEGIGGTAVITTASDVMGKQGVDELARTLHLTIQNPESLVAVNSAIVNGDHLVVVLIGDVEIPVDKFGCFEVKRAENAAKALEVINNYDVLGLGARKESSADSIMEAIDIALERAHLSLTSINCFATVDIKRDSPAMLKAAEQLGKALEFLSVDSLRSVSYNGLSPDSKMVQEKIGVGGVCERAAILLAGKNPKLILKKTKLNGVTVAIAEGE